ncbi:hypothetical protein AMECASPLE_037395 [Ameca splendens]|uniref:Uncharacterized protein n=1 Tax=Ameca splendens TaxID=208324 RepID=A0ABV1A4W7_9TELE
MTRGSTMQPFSQESLMPLAGNVYTNYLEQSSFSDLMEATATRRRANESPQCVSESRRVAAREDCTEPAFICSFMWHFNCETFMPSRSFVFHTKHANTSTSLPLWIMAFTSEVPLSYVF